MNKDIVVIGAGPAGLSFANSLADTSLSFMPLHKLVRKAVLRSGNIFPPAMHAQ
jgi:flavin-dependent dehydrogenase